MRKVAIIEARLNSSRLPKKHLKKIGSKMAIEHLFLSLKEVNFFDDIVLATTVNNIDDLLIDVCRKYDINYFRGSEDDVLGRVYQAAFKHKADLVIEISGDCVLLSKDVIEQVIFAAVTNPNVDLVSNSFVQTYPGGMDVTTIRFPSLEKAFLNATSPFHREHVITYLLDHPTEFTKLNVAAPHKHNRPDLCFVLDEEDDLKFLREIAKVEDLSSRGNIESIIVAADKVAKINQNVLRNNTSINKVLYNEI